MLQHCILIDDSDPDLIYGEAMLRRCEVCARISSFGTGEEALAYLVRPEGQRADLILLDINMPEMDGFAFLAAYEQLRDEQRSRAVVVMLTSSPDPMDRDRALAFRCVRGYVTKPLDAAGARQLLELVRAAGSDAA